jgi:oxygen-independent coproporphyrinogen-3 oxidase
VDAPHAYVLSASERAVYHRYASLALPRHTSYPIAPVWRAHYRAADFAANLAETAARGSQLSLYVHIPYCERLCYYCACTKEIVPAARRALIDPADAYLAALACEAERIAGVTGKVPLAQIHLGGGSPTFLSAPQLARLWDIVTRRFRLAADAEIAVEIDPRITTSAQLETLRLFGFNRVSLGVQDFDPGVQKAVNRLQPFETVERVVGWCRALGFGSVNFDLIYGLPFQTLATMDRTLDQVLELAPDRIAFYRLAVIPEIFRWQNVFHAQDLPEGDAILGLNLLAIQRFLAAGYEFIGLDHFARPSEPLARARRDGTLCRNFQGMTTGKSCELIGIGPSAISQLDTAFAQNRKATHDWQQALNTGFATERGLRLSTDDRIRRELMQQLYGYGIIEKRPLESRFGIKFDDYFAGELERASALVDEGIITLDSSSIRLTAPLGRLLARVVASVFDRYLPTDAFQHGLAPEQASRVG